MARSFRVLSGDRWIDGAIVGTEAADAAWERLTTTGTQLAHGPALLEWLADGQLVLRAYPLGPGARLRVAYTLEAPVCFTAGRWIAAYPIAAEGAAPVVLHAGRARVFTAAQLERELGGPIDLACAADVPLTADDGERYLVALAPVPAPAEVRFARVTAGGPDLAHVSIDVARELAPLPRGARVVFAVDASKSMGVAGIAAQLAWIGGALAHVPDASFEIVLYRRDAERVFGAFVPAAGAAARIASIDPARLVPGNGSHFDRGLAAAAALLAPATAAPRRLIAFTDERWRPSWTAPEAAAALAALPADAIVHLVDVAAGDDAAAPELARADDDELAAVAARWGGIAATASGGIEAPRAAYATAALELMRPLRIDHAVLHRGGDDEDLGALDEGAGITRAWRVQGGGPIAVEGLIWGRRWRRTLGFDPAAERRWAGLLIADPVRGELTDPEVLALATMGAVASPLTSFLAIDARYPPAGLPDDWSESATCGCDIGTISGRSASFTTTCGIGTSSAVATPSPSILASLLAPHALACAAEHRQASWDVAVGFDTTGVEIVDVQVAPRAAAVARTPDGAAFLACVEDAAWDLALDDRFARFSTHFPVRVAGAR